VERRCGGVEPIAVAMVFVIGGAVATYLVGRAWPLVGLLPALLAAAAWYAWEFSSEAVVFVALIALLGYSGLAVGLWLRRVRAK
jgi:hypothetical protein